MFAIMGACVKAASDYHVSLAQVVLFRGIPSVVFILLWVRMTRRRLRPKRWQAHALRNIAGITSMWLGFYALSHLPLSTAISLNFTSPLFIAGWMLVRHADQRDTARLMAVVLGFLGVMAILRPSISAAQWHAALVGLCAGALSAVAVLQIRSLGRAGEAEWRTVFIFSCFVCLSSLSGIFVQGWQPVQTPGWLVLIGLGTSGFVGQLAMTRAFGMGSTLLTTVLQYTTIIFGACIGAVVWKDIPDIIAFGGMALIIGAGLLSTWCTWVQDRIVRRSPT